MGASQEYQVGFLWELARQRAAAARRCGALQPIETIATHVEDEGVRFDVRVIGSLRRKDEVRKALTGENREKGSISNPFLPYDEKLFVTDVTETHLCLLNKFPVLDAHLLIVTREFKQQEELLDLTDFQALFRCMCEEERDSLAFYNGGQVGGASQPHKHLQLVPLPLSPETPHVPIEKLIREEPVTSEVATLPLLPFAHSIVRFEPNYWQEWKNGAVKAYEFYFRMARRLGIAGGASKNSSRQLCPYNVLITRDWMLIVPRRKEFSHGLSINAIGFAGGLLVRNQEQLEMVKRVGPMSILREVGVER